MAIWSHVSICRNNCRLFLFNSAKSGHSCDPCRFIRRSSTSSSLVHTPGTCIVLTKVLSRTRCGSPGQSLARERTCCRHKVCLCCIFHLDLMRLMVWSCVHAGIMDYTVFHLVCSQVFDDYVVDVPLAVVTSALS